MKLHFLYEILVSHQYIYYYREGTSSNTYVHRHTYIHIYENIHVHKNTYKYLHTCEHMYRYTQVYTHTQTHSNTHTQSVTRTCRYSMLWFYAQFSHLELASISILYISLWCRFYYKIRY